MPIIPLAIPPGINKNATSYTRRGRWEDCNLVRNSEGSVKAVGGWVRRVDSMNDPISALVTDAAVEIVRDVIAWTDNSLAVNIALGSNVKFYHLDSLGVITDITPTGVIPSGPAATTIFGYGQGIYSIGAYGVENDNTGQPPVPPTRWVFDTFGEDLVYAQRGVGPIYILDPTLLTSVNATTTFSAPSDVQDIVVTDQRIVMALGPSGNPRRVVWCDQEDVSDWVPAIDNQAGDQDLVGNGRLVRGINVLNQVLILSDNDAHIARYVGPPLVYGFELVGRNCGPATPYSVIGTERFAVWFGKRTFWLFDGSLKMLECEVIDFFMNNLNFAQISKMFAVTIQEFNEVWWFYQSASGVEVDSYLAWDYIQNTWHVGLLSRTAGVDAGTLRSPLMVDTLSRVYNHEQRGVLPDGPVFIETGDIDVANGERNVAVRYAYPDGNFQDDCTITITGKQFPTDTEYEYGPYPYGNPTPVRAMGRTIKVRFNAITNNFEVGVARLEVAPYGGKK